MNSFMRPLLDSVNKLYREGKLYLWSGALK